MTELKLISNRREPLPWDDDYFNPPSFINAAEWEAAEPLRRAELRKRIRLVTDREPKPCAGN
jgi:hypothetical protein